METGNLRRLVLAGELLRSGIRLGGGRLHVDHMASVLHLDLALDLLVNTALSMAGVKYNERDGFETRLGLLVKHRAGIDQWQAPATRLHNLRNRVQHDGAMLAEDECRSLALDAEGTFRSILTATAGDTRTLDEGMIAMLEDEEVREQLAVALRAVEEGDFQQAVRAAATAFTHARRRFLAAYLPGVADTWKAVLEAIASEVAVAATEARRGGTTVIGRPSGTDASRFPSRFASRLRAAASFPGRDPLAPIYADILLSQAGIDLRELHRFNAVAPLLHFSRGKVVQARFSTIPSEEDATFAAGFAVQACLRLSTVDVDNPSRER